MKGINFGPYHSGDDFGLILNWKKIGVPTPKTYKVPVEGADGDLDFTEYFGGVKYNNRTLEFGFTKIGGNYIEAFSQVQGVLHGRRLKIILDEDPEYYYIGRVSVDEWSARPATGTIKVTCDCEPYKYKQHKTVVEAVIGVSGELELNLYNDRKAVIPTITVSDEVTILYGGNSYSISAGTFTITNIILEQGYTNLVITGQEGTTVTVEYQEGAI